MSDAQHIQLSDGRILGYSLYGDPHGSPVFYFHGWPSSRLSGVRLDQSAKTLGIKIISVDRPGYGESSVQHNRTLLDFPDDIAELAHILKHKKFSILGVSGGGPYALACAYKIPKKIIRIATACGVGPIWESERMRDLTLKQRLFLTYGPSFRFLIPYQLFAMKKIVTYIPSVYGYIASIGKPNIDKEALSVQLESYRKSYLEGLRMGYRGAIQDSEIYATDWGFSLRDIQHEVVLFHGEKDTIVPIGMARYVASQLPACTATYFPESGHYIFHTRAQDILKSLIV